MSEKFLRGANVVRGAGCRGESGAPREDGRAISVGDRAAARLGAGAEPQGPGGSRRRRVAPRKSVQWKRWAEGADGSAGTAAPRWRSESGPERDYDPVPSLVSSIGRLGEVQWSEAYSRPGTAVKSQGNRGRGTAWCTGPSSAASADSPSERGQALRCGLAPVGEYRGAERPSVQRLAVAEGDGVSDGGPRGPGLLRWRRRLPPHSSMPTPVALPSCRLRRNGWFRARSGYAENGISVARAVRQGVVRRMLPRPLPSLGAFLGQK